MSILDQYAVIGVTVFMPTATFRVEVGRHNLFNSMDEMDRYLSSHGIADDAEARVIAVMGNAEALSKVIAPAPEMTEAVDDMMAEFEETTFDDGDDDDGFPGDWREQIEAEGDAPLSQEDVVAEIAYAFIYAHCKQNGRDLDKTRGVVGALIDNTLFLKTADTEVEYNRLSRSMHKAASRMLGVEGRAYTADFLDQTPEQPTIH